MAYRISTHLDLPKIRIIDNFLPNYDFAKLAVEHNFETMPETMNDGKYIGIDNTNKDLCKEIITRANIELPKISYGKILTVSAELLIVSDKDSSFGASRHIDDTHSHPFGYTLSYHWLGENNSGGTSFYTNMTDLIPIINIPFKQNRLVVFPAKIPHQGYANDGYLHNSKRAITTIFTVLESFS
jgi:hypothetical protein